MAAISLSKERRPSGSRPCRRRLQERSTTATPAEHLLLTIREWNWL